MDWVLDECFAFRGQTVRYGVAGVGPPLVLVHGTPFSSYVWHRIVPYLVGRRRVFLYDLLGYGQSEKRDGQDVSLGVQNELLCELLDHWHLDSPEIVGHDFGGATVLRTHLLNGRDFARITLVDPVALAPWGIGFDRIVKQHEPVFVALPADIHQAILTTYIRGATHRPIPTDQLQPYLDPWLGAQGQAAFYRQIGQFDQRYTDEIEPHLGNVRAPMLILWGEQDQWLPIAHGHKLASLIPGARLRTIPGSGHLVHEDAPEAIVAALLTPAD